MTKKYALEQELMEHTAGLADYLERCPRAAIDADRVRELADMTAQLETAIDTADYGQARHLAFTIRRLSIEWLRWEEAWLGHVNQLEKLIRILAGGDESLLGAGSVGYTERPLRWGVRVHSSAVRASGS